MRDDIHKCVPRPAKVQQWIKYALREADAVTGRSFEALREALLDACRREVSPGFKAGLDRLLRGLPDLFGPLSHIESSRALGGTGGPLESDILTGAKMYCAEGLPLKQALDQSITDALNARAQGDIRAAEAVLRGSIDPRAKVGLEQLRRDAAAFDAKEFVGSVLSKMPKDGSAKSKANLSADENLLGSRTETPGNS